MVFLGGLLHTAITEIGHTFGLKSVVLAPLPVQKAWGGKYRYLVFSKENGKLDKKYFA